MKLVVALSLVLAFGCAPVQSGTFVMSQEVAARKAENQKRRTCRANETFTRCVDRINGWGPKEEPASEVAAK